MATFCLGAAPIPLTGFVCFPASAIVGLAAVVSGLLARRQIRTSAERGGGLALAGIGIGGIASLASVCTLAFGIVLLRQLISYVGHLAH